MAAQLYQLQGRYDLALAIYLRQQQPAVFDFIQEHQLLPVLHERVAQLLSIDEERAIQLLMDQYDEIPASTVVPSIQVWACMLSGMHVLLVCRLLFTNRWGVVHCLLPSMCCAPCTVYCMVSIMFPHILCVRVWGRMRTRVRARSEGGSGCRGSRCIALQGMRSARQGGVGTEQGAALSAC